MFQSWLWFSILLLQPCTLEYHTEIYFSSKFLWNLDHCWNFEVWDSPGQKFGCCGIPCLTFGCCGNELLLSKWKLEQCSMSMHEGQLYHFKTKQIWHMNKGHAHWKLLRAMTKSNSWTFGGVAKSFGEVKGSIFVEDHLGSSIKLIIFIFWLDCNSFNICLTAALLNSSWP